VRLSELLPPAQVRVGLRARTKSAAIAELVDLLPLAEPEDRAAVLRAVLEREAESSTGIGRGVAVPHARAAEVPHLMASLATCPEGLAFDAVDGEPCRILLLLVSPPAESGAHGRALARVAGLLNRDAAKSGIAGARTPADVVAVLLEDERREGAPGATVTPSPTPPRDSPGAGPHPT
jgi:PTS system fructose-specific IIC component